MVEKENYITKLFSGTSYKIGDPRTIRELKSILEEIIADLPTDDEAEIAEVYLHNGRLDYILKEGIIVD